MRKPGNKLLYTVYNNKTGFPVIVCGTAKECADIMGIKVGTFHTLLTGQYNGNKWHVIKEAYFER